MFAQALSEGGLKSYWKLAESFTTQSQPAACGLASLVMVLNALRVDPRRVWKGVWKWWDEELFYAQKAEKGCKNCVDIEKRNNKFEECGYVLAMFGRATRHTSDYEYVSIRLDSRLQRPRPWNISLAYD